MKTLVLLYPVILLLVLAACQPRSAVHKTETADVDSVLYFQQRDLDDPFLDTVFNSPDEPVRIETRLLPPPVPPEIPPRFKEIEGFRVQVFAGIDSLNSLPVLDQIMGLTGDSVYYFLDKGLYKIQVGDYQFRYLADSAKTWFRQSGFPGAWVVQRPILIPITADSLGGPPMTVDSTASTGLIGAEAGKYRIQLMATTDAEKARLTAAALRSENNYNAFYEQSGGLYKLYVGNFNSEDEARKVLQDLRENGYPDAWLVY